MLLTLFNAGTYYYEEQHNKKYYVICQTPITWIIVIVVIVVIVIVVVIVVVAVIVVIGISGRIIRRSIIGRCINAIRNPVGVWSSVITIVIATGGWVIDCDIARTVHCLPGKDGFF